MTNYNQIPIKKMFTIQQFVSAYYFEFLPNESYTESRDRKHNFYTVYFIVKGDRYLVINGVSFHLLDGDMVLVGPDVPHQIRHSENPASCDFCSYAFVSSSPKLKKLQNRIFSLTNKERSYMLSAIFSITPYLEQIPDNPNLYGFKLKDDTSPWIPSFSAQYIELLFSSLYLHNFEPISENTPINVGEHSMSLYEQTDVTSRIKDFLVENLDKKIQLNDLARHMCMSLSAMEKIFKKNTKHAIMEYLNILRLNRARNLILYSDLTLTEIAYKTGFRNIHYFSNFFKKHTGIPPSVYAQQRADDSFHTGRTLKTLNPKKRTPK